MTDSLWNRTAAYAYIAVLVLLVLFLVRDCRSQTVRADVQASAEVWGHTTRCYQNRLSAGARVRASWAWAHAEVYMDGVWWGACDAKVPGSLLNAEAGKVLERNHGIDVFGAWRGVQIGATVRRRAVHHIWRHRTRNGWGFPAENSATWAQQQCADGEGGDRCPFLGYHDGLRPLIGYEGRGMDLQVAGPLWTWKDGLTLPWPDWTLDVSYARDDWTLSVDAQAGGVQGWALDAGARREIAGPVALGLRAGWLPVPGWTSRLRRVTAVIVVK